MNSFISRISIDCNMIAEKLVSRCFVYCIAGAVGSIWLASPITTASEHIGKKGASGLFFVSLALILLLAVAGGILLAQGLILEGSACLVTSGVLFLLWFIYYRRRRKKCDDFDCGCDGCDVIDCDCVDCNCVDCNCVDCNCSD